MGNYPFIFQRLGILLLSSAVDLGKDWRHTFLCILQAIEGFSYTASSKSCCTAARTDSVAVGYLHGHRRML